MKVNEYNYKVWTDNQQKLVDFLREQLKQLPADWHMDDHILMIMNTLVQQLQANGVPEAEARHLYDTAIELGYRVNNSNKRTKH